MDYECACGCGRFISYHKTPRQRLYYSNACRKKASRARNKERYTQERLEQEQREASIRYWSKIDQEIHRETWQDELKGWRNLYGWAEEDNRHLRDYIDVLENQLAERDAEILRLNILLEGSIKHKPRRTM